MFLDFKLTSTIVSLEKYQCEEREEEPAAIAAEDEGDDNRAPLLQPLVNCVQTAESTETQAPISREANGPGQQIKKPENKEKKAFKCTRCPKELKSAKKRYIHMRKKHLEQLYKCTKLGCGMRFGSRTKFEEHSRRHHPRHECPFCSKRFLHKALLTHHLRFGHPCGHAQCQNLMALNTPEDLSRHIQKAQNEDRQGYPFPDQSDGHRRARAEITYFLCPQCSKSFSSSGGLIDHCIASHEYKAHQK